MSLLRDGAASIIFVPQRVTSSVSLCAAINEIRALPNHIQLTPSPPPQDCDQSLGATSFNVVRLRWPI